jgi:hypothetical protein
MARVWDDITDAHREFIGSQAVFFVATAPSGEGGHVNLSPKGYDSFRVLDAHSVAYLDLTGSGAETIAHLRQNGRITVMFCAFVGKPNILRLYGTGTVVLPGDERYAELAAHFPDLPGARAVIRVDVERVSTSCGYAVPFLERGEERPLLKEWAERKGADGLAEYHAEKNLASIDGLPALPLDGTA